MNRVPTSTPSAPSAKAAARPRPSAMPPAASTGTDATALTTMGTSDIDAIQPTWPPASVPCATMTSAPALGPRRKKHIGPRSHAPNSKETFPRHVHDFRSCVVCALEVFAQLLIEASPSEGDDSRPRPKRYAKALLLCGKQEMVDAEGF